MWWWKRRTLAWMVLAILVAVLAFGTVVAASSGTQVLEDRKGDHPSQVSQPAVDTSSVNSPGGSSGLPLLASLKSWSLGALHNLKTWWDDLRSDARAGFALGGGVLGTLLGVGVLSFPWHRRRDYGVDDIPMGSVWPQPTPGPGETRLPNADEVAFLKWLFGITEDGYGPLTKTAVEQLQRSHGIPVDDQVMIGPRTWQAVLDLYQWKVTHAVPLPAGPTGDVVPQGDLLAFLQWYLGVQEDGYGPLTKERVAALQRANGIPVDDQVMIGPRTWAALLGFTSGVQGAVVTGGAAEPVQDASAGTGGDVQQRVNVVGSGRWSAFAVDWDYSPASLARYEAALNDLPEHYTNEQFLEAIIPLARWWEKNGVVRQGKTYHIPFQVCVVQAIHESDWGRSRPYGILAPDHVAPDWSTSPDNKGRIESWNLFGMTSPYLDDPAVLSLTDEQLASGQWTKEVRAFRAYPNRAASVAHYQRNLTYYDHIEDWAEQATDRSGLIQMLANIGRTYASDQNYGAKCARVFDEVFGG